MFMTHGQVYLLQNKHDFDIQFKMYLLHGYKLKSMVENVNLHFIIDMPNSKHNA